MNIDTLVARVLPLPAEKKYSVDELLEHTNTVVRVPSGARRLYVFLPAWGFRYCSRVGRALTKHGSAFLGYTFPREILSSDAAQTMAAFDAIRDRVIRDIEKLQTQHHIPTVHIIGISLGCVNATMVMDAHPGIQVATLIVPGHCLAESLWYGVRTQSLRRAYERQGMSLEELKQQWYHLAPEHNLSRLGKIPIDVVLSRADAVIPYRFGRRLVERMHEAGLTPHVREHRYGHYVTVSRFTANPEQHITRFS